ncbi:MAG: GLPGLI family protein, partial [Chryseobacterium sp.]|nr:GLPGLI family protein [Chryseobacterium sp.]
MKNTILFLIFSLLQFTNQSKAQNIRFIYNYKSIQDTLHKDEVSNEIMILEIEQKSGNSIFSALKKIESDSIMTTNSRKGFNVFPDNRIKTKYIIQKKDKKVYLYTTNHSMNPVEKVEDDRNFKWNLKNEKKEILSYSVQKATTNFAGRFWTAWFAKSLPFSDGPYKFNGLPGLILKISDEDGSHSFELIGIEKMGPNTYNLIDDDHSYFSYRTARPITNEKYKIEYLKYRNDPMSEIRQKVIAGDILFNNVNEKNDYLRQNEINFKNEINRDNNNIEKDLL